jgi:nicotinamide mononucleotide transporter
MDELIESIYQGILFTPLLEWLAVLTSILYVVFAARQKMITWFFAFVTSVLYVYLCFISELFIETLLQLFYVAMAIYGWQQWKKHDTMGFKGADEGELQTATKIQSWGLRKHLIISVAGLIGTFTLGFIFQTFTNQHHAFLDAFTTVFSLFATFMVTKRVLENWLYWIVIDAASVYLYYDRGLKLSSLLFVLFTLLAGFGWVKWYLAYRKAQKA